MRLMSACKKQIHDPTGGRNEDFTPFPADNGGLNISLMQALSRHACTYVSCTSAPPQRWKRLENRSKQPEARVVALHECTR